MRYWNKWLIAFVFCWLTVYIIAAPDPLLLFKQNWLFIFIGFGGAILGNISAVGGGIIFIPSMMFIFHLPPVTALKVALLSQCFGMTSGAIGWLQKQKIPFDLLWFTIPTMILGSSISSLLIHPSALLVKLFFGPVSIFLGVITLVLIMKNRTTEADHIVLSRQQKILLSFTSFLGGLITGWVAIGEGELVSALLMLVFNLSTTISIAIGVFLLAVNSFYLAIIHQFHLGGLPWEIACFTGLGCVFGARLAPYMGQNAKAKTLKYLFSIIAISDGILFIVQYLISK